MKNKTDYSKYKCPYAHLEKEGGHELHGPEGYQDVHSVWCDCGFRAPIFYLDPDELGLKLKSENNTNMIKQCISARKEKYEKISRRLLLSESNTDELEDALHMYGSYIDVLSDLN